MPSGLRQHPGAESGDVRLRALRTGRRRMFREALLLGGLRLFGKRMYVPRGRLRATRQWLL